MPEWMAWALFGMSAIILIHTVFLHVKLTHGMRALKAVLQTQELTSQSIRMLAQTMKTIAESKRDEAS